jgi:VanZ family protein
MLARGASWLCLIALAVLSLLPAQEIDPVRNSYYGLGLSAEHVVAYAGTAMVLLGGYAGRFGLLRAGAFLVAYGTLLEAAQAFSPGRTPQAIDLVENTVGVLVGTLLFLLLRSAREGAVRRAFSSM